MSLWADIKGTTAAAFVINAFGGTKKYTITTSGLSSAKSNDAADIDDAIIKKHSQNASNSSCLAIDQVSPQTVINGAPNLSGGLNIGSSGAGANEYIYETLGVELAPAMTNALWTFGSDWTVNDTNHTATRTP